jgi:hypothetical protein
MTTPAHHYGLIALCLIAMFAAALALVGFHFWKQGLLRAESESA